MEMKSKIEPKKQGGNTENGLWPKDLGEGEFLCEVTGAKYLPKTDARGELFVFDLKIVDGPRHVGAATQWMLKRPLVYETWRDGARKFTAEQKKVADNERIQVAFAAIVGLKREDAGLLAEGESHAGMFEKCFGSLYDGSDDPSVVVGRKVINRVFVNKKGFTNNELLPATDSAIKATKPAPKAPGLPAAKLSLNEAMAKHAFQAHPDDSEYVFNSSTEEVISVAEFKRRFNVA
jgi:hypothetical protein